MSELPLAEIQAKAAELLKTLDTSYRAADSPPLYNRFHQAAAVLAMFDPAVLKPAPGAGKAGDEEMGALMEDSAEVVVEGQKGYALAPDARRSVLASMGGTAAMRAALDANPQRASTDAQAMLEAYISGNAPPLEDQQPAQVNATFQVIQWLEDLVEGLPSQDAVRRRWDYLDLLRTFDFLAGTKFRGREDELAWLRGYVLGRTEGDARRPPLVIYGPGGVGKSALSARFIQRNAILSADERFPWAYVNFDRPGIDPEEPLTIMAEVVRQLGLQYPERRDQIEGFRRQYLLPMLATGARHQAEAAGPALKQAVIGSSADREDWLSYLGNFVSLLRTLGVAERPFLLVLDTFEEVQYRSSRIVVQLLDFLRAWQDMAPSFRPVLAGRNPVDAPGLPVENRELGDFQPEAAQALLEAEGVPSSVAQFIVEQVGGNPLSLRLALDLWQRGGKDASKFKNLQDEGLLGFKLEEGQIQGQLLSRILDHIHDPDVRRLAHPGLVLRRVTPELIMEVLGPRCGVRVSDLTQARILFDRMAQEEALVMVEGDVLHHRSDVRRIMVRLLRQREAGTVSKIERAAVRYYASRDGAEARAEEIYHRLSLGQSLRLVSERWEDGEKHGWTEQMRRLLFSARDELEPSRRAWLAARLGFELSPEEEAEADRLSWEQGAESRARRFLEYGEPRRALDEMEKRPRWSVGSPLFLLATQAYEELGDLRGALKMVRRGIQSAGRRGDRALATLLLLRSARLLTSLGDPSGARDALDSGESLVRGGNGDRLRLIEIGLYRLAIADAEGDVAKQAAAKAQLRESFSELTDEQVSQDTTLTAWLAAEVGVAEPTLMARALNQIGLDTPPGESFERLVIALAEWDIAVSAATGASQGALAAEIGFAADANATPSQMWRTLLRRTKPENAGRSLARLLETRSDVPASVLSALSALMLQRAGERAQGSAHPGTRRDESGVGLKKGPTASEGRASSLLTVEESTEFAEALAGAFDRESLHQLLLFRLDRRLETIALGEDLTQLAYQLVFRSDAEGWALDLLQAARSARPDNPAFSLLAAELGLSAASAEAYDLVTEGRDLVSVTEWVSFMGRLEAQVCRVEVGGELSGTGFLIGPETVVTSIDALRPVLSGGVAPGEITLRFDRVTGPDGLVASEGRVFRLMTDWLVELRPFEPHGSGWAILRVDGQPGYSTVGTASAESTAALRDWVRIAPGVPLPQEDATLFALGCTDSGLKVWPVAQVATGAGPDGPYMTYQSDQPPSAAGAPCFDSALSIVAVHLGCSSGACMGAPITTIFSGPSNLYREYAQAL